ncbi:hypothetical protein GCM10007981_03510 [Thermocladium modestius]|uniref:Uncharacterized protein n=1 Tax=Thermocladium modestius TaxID=62609 RepID=A0A830GS75_9CREN|nr:hypothetical protein [Thermocladium modestius]GGP19515.1 hypothetical protein GCM10007981_03510 [Thermocladium modestius]
MNRVVVGSSMFLYAAVEVLQAILPSLVAAMLHSITALLAMTLALASIVLIPIILLMVGSAVGGVEPLLLGASLAMLLGGIINVSAYAVEYSRVALHVGRIPSLPAYFILAPIMFLAGWLLASAFLLTRIRGALATVAAVLLVIGYIIGLASTIALNIMSIVRPGLGLIMIISVISVTGVAFKAAGQLTGGTAVMLRT